MPVGVALRLALMAIAFLILAPVQLLLIRCVPARAGALPMLFHRLFLRLFGIRVTSLGRPPGGTPTLVLANHVSWLDIAVIGSLAPLGFIAKSEVSGWPLIRTLARLQRTLFVDRRRRSATAEVIDSLARRLARGDSIVLFAEGTTGDGLRVLPFRSSLIGAARGVDGEATAPIRLQPLAIVYTKRDGLPLMRADLPAIAWYGDMELAPHLGAILRGGAVDATIRWCECLPGEIAADRKRAAGLAQQVVARAVADIRDPRRLGATGDAA